MSPVDPEGLWMKAKVQINRCFAALGQDDFGEAALWASFALELLGKAALAHVNPLLVADPLDDGRSLLVAAGLSADEARFKSVPAKAVFSRCGRAFKGFNPDEANQVAFLRNADLHSARTPFAGLDPDEFWGRFWGQAVVLVAAQDKALEDFVGDRRLDEVEAHVTRNRQAIASRVEALIERARRRIAEATSSSDALVALEFLLGRPGSDYSMGEPQTCPACGDQGRLLGDHADESQVEFDEDGEPYEAVSVYAEAFECSTCALRVYGPEHLEAAMLPSTFESVREYEGGWEDYGND